MSFFDITSAPSRPANRSLLLLAGVLALGQARAQLAPPPPPARTSITVSNGQSLAAWLIGPLVVGAAVVRPILWRITGRAI